MNRAVHCVEIMDRPRQALRVAERAGERITVFSGEISTFLAESANNELCCSLCVHVS
jgi:hypothetical protein